MEGAERRNGEIRKKNKGSGEDEKRNKEKKKKKENVSNHGDWQGMKVEKGRGKERRTGGEIQTGGFGAMKNREEKRRGRGNVISSRSYHGNWQFLPCTSVPLQSLMWSMRNLVLLQMLECVGDAWTPTQDLA